MSAGYTTLTTRDTGLTADAVEWCPLSDLLLCGTYELQSTVDENVDAVRTGNLQLLHFDADQSLLECVQLIDTVGVLDVKWSNQPINNMIMFACVNSNNSIQLYQTIADTDNKFKMSHLCSAQLSPNESIGLSLDWSSVVESSTHQIVASDSEGCVSISVLTPSSITVTSRWNAHKYESWITAFDHWNVHTVYSGGDDCLLKGWDTRQDQQRPTFISKQHEMGVCSIQSNHTKEHILATGSYDERLLVWDTRCMTHTLGEVTLGGGVWRIKWHPMNGDSILTATMYNGCHIVDVTDMSKPRIATHYSDHNCLTYGADWSRHAPQPYLASCSFYNHRLHIWTINAS